MDKDERSLQTYLHDEKEEGNGTRCTQCGHTIGLNDKRYDFDKQILCEECLEPYMFMNFGSYE